MIWLLGKKYIFPQSTREHFKKNPADQKGASISDPNKNHVSGSLCLLGNQEHSFWIYLSPKCLESKIKTFIISMILQVNFFMCFSGCLKIEYFFFLGGGKRRLKNCALKPKALFAVKIANVCLKQICENLQFVVGVEFCYFSQWRNCSL